MAESTAFHCPSSLRLSWDAMTNSNDGPPTYYKDSADMLMRYSALSSLTVNYPAMPDKDQARPDRSISLHALTHLKLSMSTHDFDFIYQRLRIPVLRRLSLSRLSNPVSFALFEAGHFAFPCLKQLTLSTDITKVVYILQSIGCPQLSECGIRIRGSLTTNQRTVLNSNSTSRHMTPSRLRIERASCSSLRMLLAILKFSNL